jgi:putative endonuclease
LTRNPGVNGTKININMKEEKQYYVYIMASKRNGTLYIGRTKDLLNRSFQHKLKQDPKSFTAKYKINRLIYFEEYQYVQDAILREKQLKKWNRQWKIKLIEKENPTWRDLFLNII